MGVMKAEEPEAEIVFHCRKQEGCANKIHHSLGEFRPFILSQGPLLITFEKKFWKLSLFDVTGTFQR